MALPHPRSSVGRQLFARYGVAAAVATSVAAASVAAAASGQETHARLVSNLGFDLDAMLAARFWIIPLSPFVQANEGLGPGTLALLAAAGASLIGLAHVLGQRVALAIFFGVHGAAAFATLGALAILSAAGSSDATELLHTPDTGVSACFYGSLACLALVLPGRSSRIAAAAGLTAWLARGFTTQRLDVAIAHLTAGLAGAVVGWSLSRKQSRAAAREDAPSPGGATR